MPRDTGTEQGLFQVISDLGQLKVFTDPLKVQVLRILQHQQVTIAELADMVGHSNEDVAAVVEELSNASLIELVEGDSVYRATSRIYYLFPDRGQDGVVSSTITPATIASAMAESIGKELGSSLTTWPSQLMNFEARRARMSHLRALEFNDKLVELVREYWGGPDQQVEENPSDPLMSFVGLWYRFPEKP